MTIPQKTEESSKCHGKQVFELMAAGHFFFCLVMLGRPRSSIEPPAGASLYDGTSRFPPSWSAELTPNCFIVRDANGQALAYVYFEDEPGRPISG